MNICMHFDGSRSVRGRFLNTRDRSRYVISWQELLIPSPSHQTTCPPTIRQVTTDTLLTFLLNHGVGYVDKHPTVFGVLQAPARRYLVSNILFKS